MLAVARERAFDPERRKARLIIHVAFERLAANGWLSALTVTGGPGGATRHVIGAHRFFFLSGQQHSSAWRLWKTVSTLLTLRRPGNRSRVSG